MAVLSSGCAALYYMRDAQFLFSVSLYLTVNTFYLHLFHHYNTYVTENRVHSETGAKECNSIF